MYVGAFGPISWDVMLLCALAYGNTPSEDDRKNMSDFIRGLAHVLPCSGCSNHAVEYIRNHIPDVSSSEALVVYIVTFHNAVNIQSGKRVYSVEEAKKLVMDRYLSDGVQMDRAQQLRKEDHLKISELQEKIRKRETELEKVRNRDLANELIIVDTILLSIVLVIMCICTFRYCQK
jgi:hypothetical protein